VLGDRAGRADRCHMKNFGAMLGAFLATVAAVVLAVPPTHL
jgi:hypothetical protein